MKRALKLSGGNDEHGSISVHAVIETKGLTESEARDELARLNDALLHAMTTGTRWVGPRFISSVKRGGR